MIDYKKLFKLLALAVSINASLFGQQEKNQININYIKIIDQKFVIESELEQYIGNILDKMLGVGRSSIFIEIIPNVELSCVSTESWAEQSSKLNSVSRITRSETTEFLPGTPMKQDLVPAKTKKSSLGRKSSGVKNTTEAICKIPESFVKKMNCVLLIDTSIPKPTFVAVKKLTANILKLDFDRGDKLQIIRIEILQESFLKKIIVYLKNPYFHLMYLLVVSIVFAAFLLIKRRRYQRSLIAVFLLFFNTIYAAPKERIIEIDYTEVLKHKIKLENKLEYFVNDSLNKTLGPDQASVNIDIIPNVVKMRFETESWINQQTNSSGIESGQQRRVESITEIPKSFIKRMEVVLILSHKISETKRISITHLIRDILRFDVDRGDKLIISVVKFIEPEGKFKYFTDFYFYLALFFTTLMLLIGVFVISRFLKRMHT